MDNKEQQLFEDELFTYDEVIRSFKSCMKIIVPIILSGVKGE